VKYFGKKSWNFTTPCACDAEVEHERGDRVESLPAVEEPHAGRCVHRSSAADRPRPACRTRRANRSCRYCHICKEKS